MTDDKNLVIFALLAIAILICFRDIPIDSINLLNNIISGLLGLAVGKGMAQK
jgi:hypothetical protein